jgi:biopolymer transport protein ExbD
MHPALKNSAELRLEGGLARVVFGHAALWMGLTAWVISFAAMPMCSLGHPDLPEGSAATPYSKAKMLTLSVTERGDLVLDGTWVPDEFFETYVGEKLAQSSTRFVSVEADRNVEYSRVRAVLKQLSDLGVEKIFLGSDQDPLGAVLPQAFLKPSEV